MQGEVRKSRFRLGIAAFIALCGLFALLVATPASAVHTKNPSERVDSPRSDLSGATWYNQDFDSSPVEERYYGFDPMEASVPYLAWRGEEVRLVKCISDGRQGDAGDPKPDNFGDHDAEFQIMDWSGDEHVWPKFFDDADGDVDDFEGEGDQNNRDCWAIDITSHKAGIAIVKMKVEGNENFDRTDEHLEGDGAPVMAHQFTVIWMNLSQAILRNLEGGTAAADGTIVVDAPSEDPENRLGILVKGSVPLNDEFRTDYGLPALITLPDAWVALSNTTLGHISRTLQLANDGIEGNDDFGNPTCDESPDTGDTERFDPNACDNDRTDNDYVPEPRHVPGDFWDIHDSTGPFNSGVYRPDQPMTDVGFCEGDESPKPDRDCHVVNLHDKDCSAADDSLQPNDMTHVNDTVDNCEVGEWSAFSRVFHDVSAEFGEPTIGPFSPTRPDETMLSDSRVTLNDAPMPAALVLPTILDDPADPTDAVGSIGVGANSVDKHLVYNRGTFGQAECVPPTGHPDNPHCVNAPFSGAYIPPSPTMETETADNVPAGQNGNLQRLDDDRDTASGIHAPFANNFTGYLPVCYPNPQNRVWAETGHSVCDEGGSERMDNDGLYHYWDTVDVLSEREGTATGCILFDRLPLGRGPEDIIGETPSGPDQVALYTDEHGEAQFNFVPGLGFFFDELVDPNPAGGCDLQDLDDLGSADIRVNVRYPFEPVTHAGIQSNVLTKLIRNEFEKNLECQQKANVAVATTICIVEIIDPFAPAEQIVCFETDPERAIRRFIGNKHDHDFNNELIDLPELAEFFCIRTDSDGLGAIEFTTGTPPVTVTAHFVQEPNIIRQVPPVTPPTTTTTITTATTPTTETTTTGTPTTPIVQTTTPLVQTIPVAQTTQVLTTQPVTIRRPTTTVKKKVTKKVKAKKKIKVKKKVKKVKRARACIVRGRVVRPCVRGKG